VYEFHIPTLHVNKCAACGEISFGNMADNEISQALREHLGLLSPQDIKQGIKARRLNQKQFGEAIGVAAETISRWLSGTHIQSRAMDNLMRLFFTFGGLNPTPSSRLPNSASITAPPSSLVSRNPQTGAVTLEQIVVCEPQRAMRWNTQSMDFGTVPMERVPTTTDTYLVIEPAESNLALSA
jgi:DNA-binding transcriptional regulator YiaG